MALQRTPGSFPTPYAEQGLNLGDALNTNSTNYSAARSSGGTLVHIVSPTTLSQNWKLLGAAFQAYLTFEDFGGNNRYYGKLGKILAGLSIDSNVNEYTNGQPILPFFNDNNLMTVLWDPLTDQLPPIITGLPFAAPTTQNMLPVSSSIQLPVPISVGQASQIAVGLWIEPCLIGWSKGNNLSGNELIQIWNSSYTLIFDDASS